MLLVWSQSICSAPTIVVPFRPVSYDPSCQLYQLLNTSWKSWFNIKLILYLNRVCVLYLIPPINGLRIMFSCIYSLRVAAQGHRMICIRLKSGLILPHLQHHLGQGSAMIQGCGIARVMDVFWMPKSNYRSKGIQRNSSFVWHGHALNLKT